MPRDRYDVWRDIGLEKMEQGKPGSYSRGTCIYCDKAMPEGSEKVIDNSDIHWKCFNPHPPLEDRVMMLLNELLRMTS